jgi:hypothetical protein
MKSAVFVRHQAIRVQSIRDIFVLFEFFTVLRSMELRVAVTWVFYNKKQKDKN